MKLRDEYFTKMQKEVPLVGLEQVIGNVGGILNLWVGITFLTVIEIAEIVIKYASGISDAKEEPEHVTTKM